MERLSHDLGTIRLDTAERAQMNRRDLLLVVVLVMVVALAHWNCLRGYFAADDWYHLHPRSLKNWVKTYAGDWFWAERGKGGYYRPVVRSCLRLDYAVFGKRPWGYHVSNLLIHLGCCVLIYLLGRMLWRGRWESIFAGLIFGLFPAITQAVFWISGRTDLLATFFTVLAVYLFLVFLREGKGIYYALSLVSALLAFASKELAVVLPLVILMAWLLPGGERELGWRVERRRSLLLALGFLVVLGGYLLYRQWILGRMTTHVLVFFRSEKIFSTLNSFLGFLYYPFWQGEVDLRWWRLLVMLGFPLIVVLASLKRWMALFCFLWTLLALIPVWGLDISYWNGGRLLYHPLVGWALLVPFVLRMVIRFFFLRAYAEEGKSMRRREDRVYYVLSVLVVFVFLLGTLRNDAYWQKEGERTRRLVETVVFHLHELSGQSPEGQLPRVHLVPTFKPSLNPVLTPYAELHEAAKVMGKWEWDVELGFGPQGEKGNQVLFIEPSLGVRRAVVRAVEHRQWDILDILLHWQVGKGLRYRVERGPAGLFGAREVQVGNMVARRRGDKALYSPVLGIKDAWHVLVVHFFPLSLERGQVQWRGPGEPYRGEQRVMLLNDLYSRDVHRRVQMGFMDELEQVRVEPLYLSGRFLLQGIDLHSYFLEEE